MNDRSSLKADIERAIRAKVAWAVRACVSWEALNDVAAMHWSPDSYVFRERVKDAMRDTP